MSLPPPAPAKLTAGEVLGTWGKAVAGLLLIFLTSYSAALPDGVNTGEWLGIISTTVAGTAIIWAIPKTPKVLMNYGKPIAGSLVAFLGVLATAYFATEGIAQRDLIDAFGALLITFVGPAIVSNAASSDPVDINTGKLIPVTLPAKEALVANGQGPVGLAGPVVE